MFLIILVRTDYRVGVYHLLPYAARHITICGILPDEFCPTLLSVVLAHSDSCTA